MTDQPTLELLSRYLDGDLRDEERTGLERRVIDDASLAEALTGLRRVRLEVAALADRMDPPASLDALLEPLRRGVPPAPARARPLVRWLAAAAAALLGVAVAVEVVRRKPSPGIPPPPRPPATARPSEPGIFQLRPLPTSSIPPQEAPLGAADRLLARPLPEPELADPEPLDIMGPLATPPGSAGSRPARSATTASQLTLWIAGEARTIDVALAAGLPVGRYPVRLEVVNGRVVGVERAPPGLPSPAQLAAAVVGTRLELADGSYDVELAVMPTDHR